MSRASISRLTGGIRDVPLQTEELVSGTIQTQIVKLPSDVFLWAALGSIGGSFVLQMMGRKDLSLFVGQWAPTFMILGVLDKLIRIAGSSREPV